MPLYKADLHIHTVLSPCGSLEMSPSNIVQTALKKGLNIIGITDHNSTLQCQSVLDAAADKDITVFCGVEITTKEEVHCLAFFEDLKTASKFQAYLDKHLPNIPNNPDKLGYQLVVDKDENILYEEERWLAPAIDQDINQIAREVHALNGLFIPAHINKSVNSLIAQLGFIPPDLQADAYEISKHISREQIIKTHNCLKDETILQSSDAHCLSEVGVVFNVLDMEESSFSAFKKIFQKKAES